MSLHLEFTPHSWYMGFAIEKRPIMLESNPSEVAGYFWYGYIDNGNTYQVDTEVSLTLSGLKQLIKDYWVAKHKHTAEVYAKLEATA